MAVYDANKYETDVIGAIMKEKDEYGTWKRELTNPEDLKWINEELSQMNNLGYHLRLKVTEQ